MAKSLLLNLNKDKIFRTSHQYVTYQRINNIKYLYLFLLYPNRGFTRASFRPGSVQRIIVKFYCLILITVFYSPDDG